MKVSGSMATDKVTNYIRDCIMAGKWQSGDKLPTEQEFCTQAVSYTHLDVYKRQLLDTPAVRWKSTSPRISI